MKAGEIMGLFNKKKKPLQRINDAESLGDLAKVLAEEGIISVPQDKEHNSFGQRIDKLIDADLPFGWVTAHEDFTQKVQSNFYGLLKARAESIKKSPQERIAVLEALINFIRLNQKDCAQKGECFEFWFENYLLSNDCLERYEKELEEIKENFEKLDAEYQAVSKFESEILPTLNEELHQVIKGNPGILQKDVAKMFGNVGKPYVTEALYYMDKAGKIVRTKAGNSYKLNVK
ncbi:hypothetical protein [Emergencia timonensis]|uniref:hypothetical protein n=1 Tax=Emergencia timonensis TaxID=1776384 RepID=UPI0039F6017A